jgi:hypothetical protein
LPRRPSAAERGDTDIAAVAVQALDWNTMVEPEKPAVTVSREVVALDCLVHWQYQREEAERAVSQLRGCAESSTASRRHFGRKGWAMGAEAARKRSA